MATMEVSAVQRYVRRAPRKARLVADSVKGMKVTEALAYLEFSPKHAARDVAKAIKSAAANAEHNFNLNRDDLVLKQLLIDEGPTYRRRRPVSAAWRMSSSTAPATSPRSSKTAQRKRSNWVIKSTRTHFGSACSARGRRTGLPTPRTTRRCCTRTSR